MEGRELYRKPYLAGYTQGIREAGTVRGPASVWVEVLKMVWGSGDGWYQQL